MTLLELMNAAEITTKGKTQIEGVRYKYNPKYGTLRLIYEDGSYLSIKSFNFGSYGYKLTDQIKSILQSGIFDENTKELVSHYESKEDLGLLIKEINEKLPIGFNIGTMQFKFDQLFELPE